ncbi:hypothetical protein CEXT_358321 [Caerostris extrusa]|uniref:Uncharacterized protein n=1 Tax=Caerostris extrusa TaxID=172846 RepID=A0AAV4WVR5_CAEEX|nr:hypothetical protein CEXT_358321 [Caerostris extrusa]
MVDEYLESENIQRMDWLAKSDLNLLYMLGMLFLKAITMCQPPPISGLKIALVEEWGGVFHKPPPNSLINSMHTRCACCLSVRDDHTPY